MFSAIWMGHQTMKLTRLSNMTIFFLFWAEFDEFHERDSAVDKIYSTQPWKLYYHIQTINSISQLILKYNLL